MMGLFNPYVWGGALLVLALSNAWTFWQTWSWRDDVHRDAVTVARAEAEARVREEERALNANALRVERDSVEQLRKQVLTASQSILEAKDALRNIPKCPIPRAVVGVLQPSTSRLPVREDPAPAPAPNATAVGPGAVPDETVDAATLLEVCKRNYEAVCIPNKLQVLGLQEYIKVSCARSATP